MPIAGFHSRVTFTPSDIIAQKSYRTKYFLLTSGNADANLEPELQQIVRSSSDYGACFGAALISGSFKHQSTLSEPLDVF